MRREARAPAAHFEESEANGPHGATAPRHANVVRRRVRAGRCSRCYQCGARRLTRTGFAAGVHLLMCILWCMRTNIEIDDRVLHEAQKLIGARTKREAVDVALRELVARHRRIGVLDLRGRVRWEGDLDESRRGRS